MKEFRCKNCNMYLGEMEKGKIKNGSIILCGQCYDKIRSLESLNNYKKNVNDNIPLPDFLKDLLYKK